MFDPHIEVRISKSYFRIISTHRAPEESNTIYTGCVRKKRNFLLPAIFDPVTSIGGLFDHQETIIVDDPLYFPTISGWPTILCFSRNEKHLPNYHPEKYRSGSLWLNVAMRSALQTRLIVYKPPMNWSQNFTKPFIDRIAHPWSQRNALNNVPTTIFNRASRKVNEEITRPVLCCA